jgi:hypothetical protein
LVVRILQHQQEFASANLALQSQSSELRAETNALHIALQESESQRGQLAVENQNLHDEIRRLEAMMAGQTALATELRGQLAEAKEWQARETRRVVDLEDKAHAVWADYNDATERAQRAETHADGLAASLAILQRSLEQREEQINALLASRYWKLSAPWRTYRRWRWKLLHLFRLKKENPLFDRDFYVRQNPDVRLNDMDAYEHYVRHGAAEGRDPNPLFDTDWYLQVNTDVRDSGANPLEHFYHYGAAEGRDPHPRFALQQIWDTEQNGDRLTLYLRLLKGVQSQI